MREGGALRLRERQRKTDCLGKPFSTGFLFFEIMYFFTGQRQISVIQSLLENSGRQFETDWWEESKDGNFL